jgi:hypothetical protein
MGWGGGGYFTSKMENSGGRTDGIYHLYAVTYFMHFDELIISVNAHVLLCSSQGTNSVCFGVVAVFSSCSLDGGNCIWPVSGLHVSTFSSLESTCCCCSWHQSCNSLVISCLSFVFSRNSLLAL